MSLAANMPEGDIGKVGFASSRWPMPVMAEEATGTSSEGNVCTFHTDTRRWTAQESMAVAEVEVEGSAVALPG